MSRSVTYLIVALTPFAAVAQETGSTEAEQPSALERRLLQEEVVSESGRVLTAHRPTYILPLTYSSNPNRDPLRELDEEDRDLDHIEIKFQFSLKARVWDDLFHDNGDLYFAYTQQSLWQAYNSSDSSPFRDTNYEPEMFVSFDTDFDVLGLRNRVVSVGAVHQSNGRGSETLSRSWNRIFAAFTMDRGNFALQVKPWYRIPEDRDDDDNPDIEDYLGYGDVKMAYKQGEMEYAAILRNNLDPDKNKGAVQLDWTFPLVKEIRGYVQYFNGYGECLLDYNHHDQRIGVGFMLGDWL